MHTLTVPYEDSSGNFVHYAVHDSILEELQQVFKVVFTVEGTVCTGISEDGTPATQDCITYIVYGEDEKVLHEIKEEVEQLSNVIVYINGGA